MLFEDPFVQKSFRVVEEFEGGQAAYGFEGLCVRQEKVEGSEVRLTLMGIIKGRCLRSVCWLSTVWRLMRSFVQ